MTSTSTTVQELRAMPYAPPGDRARIWHPLVLLIGSFVTFLFLGTLPQAILGALEGMSGRTDVLDPSGYVVRFLLPSIGAGFLLILLHFLFWTRFVERRPIASIGLPGQSFGRRYLLGLAVGVAFALVANIGATTIGSQLGYTLPTLLPEGNIPLTSGILAFAALIVGVFMLQTATEEVVFRGWMLSALSARTSVTLAVIVSGVAFGVFHVDRFLIDPALAAYFITATSVMGVFLATWAVHAKSIAGPMGFHAGYNVLLMLGDFLGGASTAKPGEAPATIFYNTFSKSMTEAPKYLDFIMVNQSIIVLLCLTGMAAVLLSRREEDTD